MKIYLLGKISNYILIVQSIIFGFLIAIYLMTINLMALHPYGTDFYKFYMSSRFFWNRNNVYALIPINNTDVLAKITNFIHPNLNAPFHILCMSLFGLTNFETAFWIWSLFSLFCGLLAIVLFYKSIKKNDFNFSSLLTMWIIILFYFPSWINCRLGQFSFVLLLLIIIGWKFARRGQDVKAGIILGLAAGLKLFLGIFIIVFIVYRRWRLIFYFIGTFLACNILTLTILKIPTFLTFFSLLKNMPWYAASWNASFLGFFTRIFGGSMNTPIVYLPWLARTLAFLLSLILLILLARQIRTSYSYSKSDSFDLVFSLALVEMLLISPYGWLYYFPILVIPLIIIWKSIKENNFNKLYRILIILIWAFTTIPTSLIWAEDPKMNQPSIWFTSAGIYFYALLAFTAILICFLYKSHQFFPLKTEP